MQVIRAKVTTAIKLSESQGKKITQAIQAKYPDKKVELEEIIDPKVIGGVNLVVDAIEYDGTVAGKLGRLKEHMQKEI